MSPSSLTVKQKLANGFVIFTAIWSSVIMPVVPAYAKMLDNKELPSLGSDQIINEDNTERLVAEHTKTVGTFLSQKKTMKDLSEMAQDYARNKVASEATKEIEHWLSKAGNVKLNIDIDKKFSVKNSQFDWLIPWYDQAEFLLFTQHSLHRYDERFHTNNGIGLRHFHEKSTIGMNAFIDHDFSHAHTRAGLGVEYWQNYLKLNANSYFGLTAWKSAPELNHDYNAKPAHGWDIQIEGWLPAYPHLGGNLKYEQYYGDSVALFGKTKRQKNPNAATIGANWTPFPLFTLNASHKLGSEKRSETQAKLQFTWTFGKSLAHHLDPTKVAEARRLSGNRYDFVERNNNIILNYQKKTLLHLSLPTKIQGVTGQSVPLVKSFTGKYPLKHIEWQAPEFLAAGGLISSTDQTATLTLPSYKTSKTAKDTQKINRYRLRATAYDVKDNASPVAETLIEITHSGAVSISPRDMKFHGKGLANGHDVNRLTAIVRDSLGNPVSNAKVVFVLPNTLTLASQKKKSAANSSVQNSLRKKMQAMKISKPWEYIATTDDKGEAQVQFTSQIAGSYEISAYSSNQQPVKAQATFIPDVAQAYIHNFTVSRAGVIADGVSTHSVQAHITDKNKNSIANQEVTFSATHAKIVDKATTDKNGLVEVTLTSLKAGPSEVTLSVNGHSETKTVEFISGKLHQVTILDVPEVYAGRESQVSFQLLDSHGNPIIDAKNDITVIIDKKAVSEAISHTDINNGIYAAKTLGQQPGEHTIQVVMDKLISPERTFITRDALSVKSATTDGSGPAGALGVIASIEIDINPNRTDFKSGDNPLVIATLKDSFGNEIENIDPKNIHFVNLKGKNLGWRQNGNYDYAINLPLTTIGDIDITTHVNGIYSPKTILTVSRNSGISNIQNVVVTPTNKTPNAGDIPTLTVKLTDNSGNPVNDIQQLDVTIGGTPHALPATQNPDGSYTVELPAQHSGDKQVQVTVNGQPSNTATLSVNAPKPITNTTTGKAGEQGVLDKLTLSSGTLTNLKSGDTLALTVEAQDAFKNPLTGLASTITLTHAQAGTVTWTDNQDGTYTASLVLSKLGSDSLTAAINKVNSKPLTLTVNNAAGNTHVHNVVVTPTNKTPNAGDIPTLKVELTDSNGNVVNGITQLDVTIGGTPQTLPATQNKDGSYTVELPAQHSGQHDIQVTVNGQPSNTATLTVNTPKPITNTTGKAGEQGVLDSLTLSSGTLTNLKSGDTLALTVTAQDAFKNPLTGLASTITLTHAQAGTVTWTDNQDGTYTASLPLTKLGADTLTATINKVSSKAISVNVANLTGHAGVQNVVVTPTNTTPNAGDIPTLKVELTDSNGNVVNGITQLDVTIGGTPHALPATQNPDGSYTVTLPAQHSGKQDIQVTVNGQPSNTATLTVNAPKPITNTTGKAGEQGVLDSLTLSSGTLTNLKSGDTLALTVTAQDAFKNPLTGLASTITLTHAQAGTVTWTDNQDGTYTASLPLTKLGADTLTATINKVSSKAISVNVANLTGHAGVQNVVVTPTNTTPNAGDIPTLKVELTDSNGNVVNGITQLDVTIGGTPHALPATQNKDGSYTVTLPAQHSGKQDIQVTVNGQPSNTATLSVNAPKPITNTSTGKAGEQGVLDKLTLSSGALTNLKSGDTLALTVEAQDAFKNPLTGLASTITLTHAQAGAVTWKDNQDGTYTASLALSKLGSDSLTAAINKISSKPITINVANLTGHAGVQNVAITPTNTTPNAGDIPTLTVKLTDNNGNTVNDVKHLDVTIGGTPHALPATQNPDGSYTVTLPAQHSGKQDIQVTVNGQPSNNATLSVNAPKPITTNTTGKAGEQGVLDKLTLSSGALTNLKSGDTLALTVTVQDTFKNPLTGLASTITLTHAQAGTVTWTDNKDGTYSGTLSLSKLGADTLTAAVGTNRSQDISITVEPQNSQKFVTAVKLQTQHPQISAGEKATIILTLHDKYQNGVVQISSNDIKLEDNKLALSNIQWQEQGNGVYITELPLSQLGNHKLISTVNFLETPAIDVDVTALRGAIRVHHVSLDATPKQFVVGQKVQLTLTLLDQFNNGVMDVLTNEININDDNTRSSLSGLQWHYQQNGVYIADTIITKGGVHSLKATVNSKQHSVLVNAITSVGQKQVSDALLTTNTASITAGSSVTLTLELKDQHDNSVSQVDSSDIVLTNNSGASIPTTWVEMSNLGVYTTKTQLNTVGDQTLTMTVNSISRNIDLHVTSPHGASSVAQLKVSPIKAVEAGQISSLIVAMKDQYGNAVNNVLNRDVAIEIDGVAHSIQLTELGDSGQYTGQLPALLKGQHTVKITVNGQVETSNWTINNPIAIPLVSFDKTEQRGALEKMTLRSNKKSVGSGEKAILTLNLMDKFDNPLTGASSHLRLLTNLKETSNWQDNHDGSYSIELLMNRLGSQAVQAIVKNQLSKSVDLDISALSGASSVNTTALTIKDAVIEAGDTTELTLLLKDSVDNGVINIQDSDIHLTQNNAKLKKNWSSTVNGLYTTPLQINQVGVYPLRAIINQQNSRIETIEVTDPTGHTKVANAKLTTNITSLEAGKSVELTLELKDQYNNLVKGVNGVNITLNDSHASETIDSNQIAWRMDSVGIYKASLPLLRTGKHTLQVTVNHQKAQTSEITVNALKGAVNISKIELTSAKNTISAGEKTTLTLKMQDRFGNEVDNVSVADIELKNTDAQVTTQATWVKVPTTLGTYTTGIQLNNVKSHTLIAKVNGQTQTVQIDVTPQKGASHVAALTLQVPATTEVAEKTKLTLTLTDQFGNNVIAVENQHIELMLGSTRQNVTWIEAQDGTYQADLTLNQVGNHTITVGVNTLSGTKSLHVNSPSGKDHVASIQLSVTANPALPNASTKLTLTLKDKYGNGVKDIRSADISLSDSHLPENFVSPTWAEESSQTGVYTALVNLKKVADHTLTASLNNIDKTIKVTVQPFAEAQQVNDIELSVDNKNIIVDGKVTFTLTTKDIYGNNVSIKAADIQMQNANGALNQPTWTMQGEQHKGELILSLSGDYVITAHVGTKVSSPVKVTVKAGSPVFAAGKSEFSVNSDAIDEGSNTNVVVTLVLKDANGNLIKKKKPRVSANKGTITGTMNEIRDGVYTSNFNNPVIGISTISLDRNSIDYAGTTPTISVVTYGKLEIKTIDYAHTFSVNDKFPHTGFVGAQFQIIVPIGKQTDYNWSVDIDWLSIDEQGIVTMLRKPTPIKNGNAMIPIFKGVPKANTGYKRTVDYRFTLKKWYFNNKGKLTGQAAMNACQAPSRLIARDDLLTSGLRYTVPRKAGERVFHEWNSLHVQNKLSIKAMPWLADGQTATSATQVLNPFTNEIEPIRNSTLEMETICVEDLK
ncbi:invasin domain 3-containing protein [Providencia alcalifaciens]|uniref:invasin domain 3-containing protein n=1 Tax=Providencia alcalifaciens TaxID=126385 RepID=UPI002B057FCF|nr:invasin domain 3-containing protein [Providencia alcalifaciens]